ncbi:hypothetical protein L1765_14965 [Microaerobacter geothermalis]|uniref:hypothetical protein n=1 Tax=Microaerobacter geothermalis TaxID=674972 RepID=UPI001F316300|nr:hypothetical protein [Microaerobacter geothermalis]MCF6095258.1 hypothetical protein [Microaerobacter geothermalis]
MALVESQGNTEILYNDNGISILISEFDKPYFNQVEIDYRKSIYGDQFDIRPIGMEFSC